MGIRDTANTDVFIYTTKNGLSSRQREQHCQKLTDAKKLDIVHNNTVTSNSEMPSVRLATPPSPIFACHPDDRTVDLDRFVDATEALSLSVLENDLLGGRIGSLGAIFVSGDFAICRRTPYRRGREAFDRRVGEEQGELSESRHRAIATARICRMPTASRAVGLKAMTIMERFTGDRQKDPKQSEHSRKPGELSLMQTRRCFFKVEFQWHGRKHPLYSSQVSATNSGGSIACHFFKSQPPSVPIAGCRRWTKPSMTPRMKLTESTGCQAGISAGFQPWGFSNDPPARTGDEYMMG
ncbi:uncharacterized protein CLUP02_08252 [Colletotrichum lupini]|uniref:Uncharacterized protein n=1 Tax=Colletotrichum lupini TaxID=145971 RepID=A0A9Q8WHA3_9PEZI|nr:uncharacterized protein CLUP02_08252 [Colletotrichum lupini]UQC82762.1 hypothetical protein CLUP02_08252 [Colletotrichum lupini]